MFLAIEVFSLAKAVSLVLAVRSFCRSASPGPEKQLPVYYTGLGHSPTAAIHLAVILLSWFSID